MAAPLNTDGIAALSVDPLTGTLFGVALNDSDVVHPAYLVTINTATGQVTTIGASPTTSTRLPSVRRMWPIPNWVRAVRRS